MLRSALIVGSDSQIGSALATALRARGVAVHGTTRRGTGHESGDRSHLDLAQALDDWSPPTVECAFLCAAITSIAACQRDPSSSWRVNVHAPVALAERLNGRGSHVVFLSTNLVFDGTRAHRLASEPPSPTTEYGKQKAEAERQLLEASDSVAILRLTKVLARDQALLQSWRDALRRGEVIHPFPDVVLAPVAMDEVTDALTRLGCGQYSGIFQLSGDTDMTYAELALALGSDPALIQPVAGAAQYALPPPAHTTLDTTGLRDIGMQVRTTRETIEVLRG